MGVEISVTDDTLTLTISGLDALVGLARTVQVPIADITGVVVMSRQEARADLGWRVGGGYFPGLLATGWFTVPGRKGLRQWWMSYRDPEVLVVDTSIDRPARIVVQTPDRERILEEIRRRIPPA